MKNTQIIDGAQNCVFSVFKAEDAEFAVLFPEPGQDIQFAEDIPQLPNINDVYKALERIWDRPIRKRDAYGIHGTIFYKLERYRQTYPTKREDEVDPLAINAAQRRLFGPT